ncbi:unnamed protein product [Moneuplotes crassus]|uniref:Uncharacterized protein n=1 Tax=Euplotes crassus TaxID=5936 RepID=A0AAD1U817_EUPCR|nr:unnamed protein product [Moneuplotes crassus]
MWKEFSEESQNLDLDYLYQELDLLKSSLEVPYIDKRAKDDDLNEDLLEEVKIAFNEISLKEKGMKQLIQIMEFALDKYSTLSDEHRDTKSKLSSSENELTYYKDTIVANMTIQLERNENNLEDLEEELIKAEREIRELKEQINNQKPEVTIFKNIQEMEKRVRRQSMLETRGHITGLEEALETTKSTNQKIKGNLDSLKQEIVMLSKENKKLKRELQNAYDNNDRIARDVEELNKMKSAFEAEFTEVVDSKDNEITQLAKRQEHLMEELKRAGKKNKELEGKMSKFKEITSKSPVRARAEIQVDRIDTSASNEDDLKEEEKRSTTSVEDMFDEDIRENANYERRGTYESLKEVMGNRNSYYGRETETFLNGGDVEELKDDDSDEDFERMVDVGTQTVENTLDSRISLKTIEEEKYQTTLQSNGFDDSSRFSRSDNSTFSFPRIIRTKGDALEDFFKMSVLANKIGHQDLDKVCHIKAKKLYKKCKETSIPFQDWHNWIEKQINDLYLKKIYENKANSHKGVTKNFNRSNTEDSFIDISFQRSTTNGSDVDQLRKYFSDKSKNGNYHAFDGGNTSDKKCIIF